MGKKKGANLAAGASSADENNLKGCVSSIDALDLNGNIVFCVQTQYPGDDQKRQKLAGFVAAEVEEGIRKLQADGKTAVIEGEEINADHSMGAGASAQHFRTFAYSVRIKRSTVGSDSPGATLVGYVVGRLLAEGYVTQKVIRESERGANRIAGLPIVRDMLGTTSDVPASMLADTVGRVVVDAELAGRPKAKAKSAGA